MKLKEVKSMDVKYKEKACKVVQHSGILRDSGILRAVV